MYTVYFKVQTIPNISPTGESLSDIHAAARLVNIDERSPIPGMVRLPLHPQAAGGPNSAAANRGIYSTTTAHRDHTHGIDNYY